MAPAVAIVEVGPRDGLQSHDSYVETDAKVVLIERLLDAGLREIEVTSFAHPKMVPHLADAEELMRRLPHRDGVVYRTLVPNRKGAERAIAAGADVIVAFVSASATYSERNQNMTLEQALEQLAGISELARDARIEWTAAVSMAFDSPYEGPIAHEDALAVVERCAALGPDQLYVADTIGRASPERVRRLCAAIRERRPALRLGAHLHGNDTRGLDCAAAAVEAGAAFLESSICGLGGPVVRSPGAPPVGNLPTETLVTRLAELGVDTGLDPDAVSAAARDVAALLGLPGAVAGRGASTR